MLTTRITHCKNCIEISGLLATIDCKIFLEAKKLYENSVFMLNLPVDRCLISDLIHYKRILTYKQCEDEDDEYADNFCLERIANQIRTKTIGCNNCCDISTTTSTTTEYMIPTTTTTSSTSSTSTTTTTSSSSTTTSTTTTMATTSTTTSSSSTTTTSTTASPFPCNTTTTSGGGGITEVELELNPAGGLIVMDWTPMFAPDKMEFLHNGVKVATSGMTVPNEGPFDNIYGDPLVPTAPQTIPPDQFIGLQKGPVPSRIAAFYAETGILLTESFVREQLIWFKYTAADFLVSNKIVVRIVGAGGTAWVATRRCF